jgi:hypothetical protein
METMTLAIGGINEQQQPSWLDQGNFTFSIMALSAS